MAEGSEALNRGTLIEMLRRMLRSRRFEEQVIEMVSRARPSG